MQTTRNTKYIDAVRAYVAKVGHATNLDIQRELQKTYPNLSATTIHRITTRLYLQKQLQLIPTPLGGSMHYDSNLGLHDHFYCIKCGVIKDFTISSDLLESLKMSVEQNVITERLVVMGNCNRCSLKTDSTPAPSRAI